MVALTRNGRFAAFRQANGVHVVDLTGPSPRRIVDAEAFSWIGDELWTGQGSSLYRPARSPMAFDGAIRRIGAADDSPGTAIVECEASTWLVEGDRKTVVPYPGVACVNRGRVVALQPTLLGTLGRVHLDVALSCIGDARSAAFLFGGRAIAAWVRERDGDALVVSTLEGKRIHRLESAPMTACAFAESAGLAIVAREGELVVFDLRVGTVRNIAASPCSISALAIDAQARHVIMERSVGIHLSTYDELFQGRSLPAEEPRASVVVHEEIVAPAARDLEVEQSEPIPDVPALALAAFHGRGGQPFGDSGAGEGALPYDDPGQHLAALLDVVASRAALAIAEAWHTGRTSHDATGDLPNEREVLGLLGEELGLADEALQRARDRVVRRSSELAARTHETLQTGLPLPFHEVASEAALSPIAMQILAFAAAPRLRGSIARLYGVLANVTGAIECTTQLLEHLVDHPAGDHLGNALAIELGRRAPLIRTGLVDLVARDHRTSVCVDEVLVARLRGLAAAHAISDVTTRRSADRALPQIHAPDSVKRQLVNALKDRPLHQPARIVIRGRRGAGRHTLIAALASTVGRSIAAIDTTRLPRGARFAAALARELVRANLASCVPVISGLDALGAEESPAEVERVLAAHAGPIIVRAAPEGQLPIDPDHVEVALPPLSIHERTNIWRATLATLDAGGIDDARLAEIATRFRFGAGTIARVAEQAARVAAGDRIEVVVHRVARQHIAQRLERVATRVTRLPDWNHVILADDMRDSVRELVGRMRHQRTVFEDWGFDERITTARGLTALFYGPPGTGKTLVAGLIGRELGLDVWRIDLSRVISKWVGETEKQLAEVFEAADEGQVLLLFDEADSLFGKRSEVKSSNDRYANLETNYLLQRLDSFEGVAILTTNLEGCIDPAFKRRLTMRMYFPFPDEEQRERLWASHVPPSVPTGPLDFAELARRFPLSGGYIRNSAMRAAFLAAQEELPLAQDHLLRAVHLEYRELGKLFPSGRMD